MKAKANEFKDIAIWGHPPPPYGGMTIHISRLLPRLIDENISVQMYSISKEAPNHNLVKNISKSKVKWYLRLLIGSGENTHYIVSGKPIVRFLASMLTVLRGRKVIFQIGGWSLKRNVSKGNIIKKYLTLFAIRNATVIIAVNKEIYDYAISL